MKLGPFLLWPQQAAEQAAGVDLATLTVLAVCSFFALAVLFFLTFFALKYRQGRRVDRKQPPLSNHSLEIAWIVLPTPPFAGTFLGGCARI